MVYLFHFSRPIGNSSSPRGQAQHYLGSSPRVIDRVRAHQRGYGAKLTRAAFQAGCTLTLARIWSGDRQLERQLKRQKNNPRLCPLCNPKAWTDAGLTGTLPKSLTR